MAEEWVPRLASGELLALLPHRAGGGLRRAALKTRAVRDGEDYLLDGSKVFISGAGCTDVLVVMARTGGEGPRGSPAFMVPAQTPA